MKSGFIAVDWGTARVTARVVGGEAALPVWRETVRLSDLDAGGIAGRVEALATMWPGAAANGMVLSGMIGSASGWREVARTACPADADAVAAGAWHGSVGRQGVTILPGLACRSRFGDSDVLRGEEVPAIGTLSLLEGRPAQFLSVPGMHGKWIRLDDGRVRDFHTAMTVELHGALAAHTVLSPLMSSPARDGDTFRAGVRRGASGALARHLFAVRAAVLAGSITEEAAHGFLWGILAGADAVDAVVPGETCFIAGVPEVAALYAAAIETLGGKPRQIDGETLAVAGYLALAPKLAGQESRRWANV